MTTIHHSKSTSTMKALFLTLSVILNLTSAASSTPPHPNFSVQLPGSSYEQSWEEAVDDNGIADSLGAGREFSLFDSRGGSFRRNSNQEELEDAADDYHVRFGSRSRRSAASDYSSSRRTTRATLQASASRKTFKTASDSSSGNSSNNKNNKHNSSMMPPMVQSVSDWWSTTISPNFENWPKVQCRIEPSTTLKIRKTFRPLKTIVRLGADFNTQRGIWQFKSSWEDRIIGGKLTLAGRELQLSKSWQLSVGAVEDLVTRLRLRAAIDLQTGKAYARVGFRTERLSPINVVEGFTLMRRIPLDGRGTGQAAKKKSHIKLEVKANVALPEPEIEYSTETQRSLVGMGDIEFSLDELNLLLDY